MAAAACSWEAEVLNLKLRVPPSSAGCTALFTMPKNGIAHCWDETRRQRHYGCQSEASDRPKKERGKAATVQGTELYMQFWIVGCRRVSLGWHRLPTCHRGGPALS